MVPFVSNTTFRLWLVPGFGDAESTWPYITGDWSVEGCGVQPMSFGGILFASWVMIAKEAHTSDSVKELIVKAGRDVPEGDRWHPYCAVRARGADSQNCDLCPLVCAEERWGGREGSWGSDYEETVLRPVCLMYIEHQKRWIDLTLRNPLGDRLRRVEERFTGVNGTPKDRFCKVIHRLLKDTCRLPNGLVRSQYLSFLISMLDSKSGSRRTLFGQRKTSSIKIID
ncbi:uncharacterized protein EI90DRAFT_3067504, partial [Cantharellus anzutake]|uniref:uncharacterized protein n=1 Tax=Cantharellus anzutake TaxID=1750568 RepID=UPI0019081409